MIGSTDALGKNIVICSDGTGNTAIKDRGTNVFKLYEAIDVNGHISDPTKRRQVAFYDDGVGTENFKPLKLLGGAFGWGLSRNVKELYAALVRSYEPKDDIFLFGFSRGAFTVRTLGDFITSCGILHKDYKTDSALVEDVEQLYKIYRSKYQGPLVRKWRPASGEARFKNEFDRFNTNLQNKTHQNVNIKFIGVWDTVDAVGLPFDWLADILNHIYPFKFSNFRLHPQVEQACHAISIDDERETFHPVMWKEKGIDYDDSDRIKQVWFSGVHANVGGGYPKQGMSLVALDWMMTEAEKSEAEKSGLRFIQTDRDYYREHQDVNDKLYNSRAGLAVYYRYKPRDINKICKRAETSPKIHDTVIDRMKQCTEGYAPGNFPASFVPVATSGASRYEHLPGLLKEGWKSKTSCLDDVKGWIFVRRGSHYVFVGMSIWILISVGKGNFPQESAKAIKDAQSIMETIQALFSLLFSTNWIPLLIKDLIVHPGLYALALVFYGIGGLAGKEMRKKFSEFFHIAKLK